MDESRAVVAQIEPSPTAAPILIDLGRKKRKAVKKLRKGCGRLMDDIGEVVAGLKSEGTITDGAQVVVVVVREKRRRRGLGLL
jgi:hypothetical protein